MDIPAFKNLLTEEGRQLLAHLKDSDLSEENMLRYITDLRKGHPRDLVDAAIETTFLRRKAGTKFSRADEMYFTAEALEQASGEQISAYRAERYASCANIADLACGIGGDTIALAQPSEKGDCPKRNGWTVPSFATGTEPACQGHVLAIDNDSLRLAMAAQNARAYGITDHIEFREADINDLDISGLDAIFFDPSRRSEGRRVPSVFDYSPPLSIIDKWLPHVPAIGVKISPAMRYSEITWDCEIEFISLNRELKEAVLWFGPLKTTHRRATLLQSQSTLTTGDEPLSIPITEPLAYLYEPDPAVIRSHLVETLAEHINASKLDPDIAYLTSVDRADTLFARRYVIEETMPFNLKKLRERLRSLDVGRAIVKKRGSPIDPRELQKRLKLNGSREIVVVLTHLAGKPSIILCSEDSRAS